MGYSRYLLTSDRGPLSVLDYNCKRRRRVLLLACLCKPEGKLIGQMQEGSTAANDAVMQITKHFLEAHTVSLRPPDQPGLAALHLQYACSMSEIPFQQFTFL